MTAAEVTAERPAERRVRTKDGSASAVEEAATAAAAAAVDTMPSWTVNETLTPPPLPGLAGCSRRRLLLRRRDAAATCVTVTEEGGTLRLCATPAENAALSAAPKVATL